MTLVREEGSFEEGSKAISDAIKNYRECLNDLTLPILAAIYQGTQSFYFLDSSSTEK
jgi:hypothetical protein